MMEVTAEVLSTPSGIHPSGWVLTAPTGSGPTSGDGGQTTAGELVRGSAMGTGKLARVYLNEKVFKLSSILYTLVNI